MKKIDYISLGLSIIINLVILFLLTYKSFERLDDVQTIKIGLVSLDTNASTNFKGEENKDASKQNLEAKTVEENPVNEKVEETKPTEKVIEKDAEKVVSEVKEETPKEEKKEKPSLKDLKKSISESKPNLADLVKNSESFSPSSSGDNVYVDRKMKATTDENGLVSGNIGGTSGGDEIQIIWANNNRVPSFPDKAKAQGKTGSMIIRLQVDQAGNVLSYVIEEGSGVPEIDIAVERVISSWNLKMKKNNKIVAGVFLLDYNFDFK